MRRSNLRHDALAAALMLAILAPCAHAQQEGQPAASETDAEKAAAGDKAKTLDSVTVLGSRIKRAEVEGPAPVTVITGEQMKKEGFATVYDALQTLTEAIGNVQNDYDWGQTSVNASPLNLRNLGPGRSLLLINGHRVADYPVPYQGKSNFANYNNIPSGIVERIEILAGSASAIYGSDAMAGVVNVVLKTDIDAETLRLRYGKAERGGRKDVDLVFSGGLSGDKWNLVYNLQHFDRGVLMARDRPFMDSEQDKPFAVWGPGERHFNTPTLTPYPGLRLRNLDASPSQYIAPPAGACDQYGGLYFDASILSYNRNTGAETNRGSYCAQNVFQNWALRTGSKDTSGYLYGTLDLKDDLQAWTTLGVWKSTGQFNSFLDAFASPVFWDPRANNGAGGTRDFLKFHSPQEIGASNILTESDELAVDLSAGLRGTVAEGRFDWEAMLGRAEYEVKESFPVLDQGAMRDFYMGPQLGTTAGGLPIYTPDYGKLWNPVAREDIAAFSDRGTKKAKSWLTQASFVVSGNLFEGWAGPIGFAGVVEAAKQGYRLTPDPKILNQDEDGWYTPFGNIEQGGGERNHYAVGAEFRVPLAEKLLLTTAGRYDKYDAVADGAASTYQLGLEWRPFSNLLLRGSYGTSFRAPDMHFVYAAPSSGIADFTDYNRCYTAGWPNRECRREDFLADNVTVARSGTPDLKYETGKSFTYGFVWDAFTGFSISVDYWRISIDNLIDDIGAEQLLLDDAYCLNNGWTPDGTVRPVAPSQAWCDEVHGRIVRGAAGDIERINTNPINRADTRVSGVDLNARYRIDSTRIGDFGFALNYTNMLKYESRAFPTDRLEDSRKTQNPRTKITASVNWSRGDWNATLLMYQKSGGRNNRWGGCLPFDDGYVPSPGTGCEDVDPASPTFGQSTEQVFQRRAPRRYFNGSVGYKVNDALNLNFYVSNLFDKIYGDQWCGDFAYCIDDPVGRTLAAEVVYKFD